MRYCIRRTCDFRTARKSVRRKKKKKKKKQKDKRRRRKTNRSVRNPKPRRHRTRYRQNPGENVVGSWCRDDAASDRKTVYLRVHSSSPSWLSVRSSRAFFATPRTDTARPRNPLRPTGGAGTGGAVQTNPFLFPYPPYPRRHRSRACCAAAAAAAAARDRHGPRELLPN